MQHATITQNLESRFADGLSEYKTLYGGGLQRNYNRPPKLASTTVQELDASPPLLPSKNPQRMASKFANASYDLATHVPQYRRDAEGLQIVEEAPPRTSSLRYSKDLVLDERLPKPPMGHSVSSPSTLPAPLFQEYHVPHSSLYYSSRAPTMVPQPPLNSDVPQPLRFKRAETMPMTQPISNSGSSEGGIRDSMASLSLGGQQPAPLRLHKSPSNLPPATLSRMGTVSSTQSSSVGSVHMRSSSIGSHSSPFPKPRFSVAAFTTGAYKNKAPDMSSNQAKAEIMHRLELKDITSSRKGSSGFSIMKSSLRRSSTAGSSNGGSAPEVLSQVL